MGCGTSKAAQVVEGDITIINHPARTRSREPGSPTTQVESLLSVEGEGVEWEGVSMIPSDQSGIERTVQEILAQSPAPPSLSPPAVTTPTRPSERKTQEITSEERRHEQAPKAVVSSSSTSSMPKPVAFEVCMSPDGSTSAKKPPPRRLAKLDSAPKLTSEMLAEKQRVVEERKAKELEKRANKRVSKRDRLRREIMEARAMEEPQQQVLSVHSEKQQRRRDKHGKRVGSKLGEGEEGSGSLDASVDIEVDSTYNTEQDAGFWNGSQESSEGGIPHRPSSRTTEDEDFFFSHGEKTNLLDSSSQSLEQSM